jgi:sugar-specific transcriptional regulator TrmB
MSDGRQVKKDPLFFFSNQNELKQMSLEKVIGGLVNLGLSKTEAEVYIQLAMFGPAEAAKISRTLSLKQQRLYRSLKRLQQMNIITVSKKNPSKFSALPFEKVLTTLIEMNQEQAKAIKEVKKQFFSDLQHSSKKYRYTDKT